MLGQIVHFLETNAFSDWVLTSAWGFPWLIALHSVGMGFAAGLGSVAALRASGRLTAIPVDALPRFFLIAWLGFWLNFVTGLILLMTRISEYLTDPTFLVKMGCVLVAAAALRICQKSTSGSAMLAWLSIAAWMGAVTAGRWIAYLSGMYG